MFNLGHLTETNIGYSSMVGDVEEGLGGSYDAILKYGRDPASGDKRLGADCVLFLR